MGIRWRARQEKIRRALQNNIKGGIVKEQEGVRNRVRCRRACVCVRENKDPSLMIFFANDEVPRAILSFESVYQRHAEVKEVQRGVIIFFPLERCHKKERKRTCASTVFIAKRHHQKGKLLDFSSHLFH